jgi:predicted naringenin-chalcone synthase
MFLNRICHYTPPFKYGQNEALDLMKSHIELDDKEKRIIDMIYRLSAIEYRYSMVGDLKKDYDGDHLFIDEKGKLLAPIGTAKRNAFYEKGARIGFIETAKSILQKNEIKASEITHVITVSCTGFYAPGPDYDIVSNFNMSPLTQRYHIGFMGCYAAFPAMRMAEAFIEANNKAKLLVICIELCD